MKPQQLKKSYFYLLLFVGQIIFAQAPAEMDLTFNPTDVGFGNGDGAYYNTTVRSVVVQPDGKIIIGGGFTSYNGTVINRIARLNTDGTLDTSFNVGTGFNNEVYAIALQPDGKILVAGLFTNFNNISSQYIARLNPDGSSDVTFNLGTGANSYIASVALQSDGKIIIGGEFTSYNGTVKNRIARLNTDGSLDVTFNMAAGVNNSINSIAVQSDGKILVAGGFTYSNGITNIARLNNNGTLDLTFNSGSGVNNYVYTIVVQLDNKILVGGNFTTYNGTSINRIARLNSDGTLDGTFNVGTGANDTVYSIVLSSDYKILIGGYFNNFGSVTKNHIARLNNDGALDTSFDSSLGANDAVYSIVLPSEEKILIGGSFNTYNNITRNGIARINADNTFDISFNTGTGANNTVYAVAVQSDGKTLIGGGFTIFNGEVSKGLKRINSDGSIDTSFNLDSSININVVKTIVLQPDGKILVGGLFFSSSSYPNCVRRLNQDGSLDPTFNVGAGASSRVDSIVLQPDGKILIGGDFSSYNGVLRVFIARLNQDGTLDTSFSPNVGATNNISKIALQPDGKVLIVGGFISCDGINRNRIARLNANGSLDTTFNPGTGANDYIYSVALQPTDNKIIIGGTFTSYRGIVRKYLARINTDGTLDTGFNAGITGANVLSVILQPDNKILLGGGFYSFGSVVRPYFARLNSDSTLDTSFNTGVGSNGIINSVAFQSDGKMLIGGQFTSYNGIGRNRIARLYGDSALNLNDYHKQQNLSVFTGSDCIMIISKGQNINSIHVFDLLGNSLYVNNNVNTTTLKIPSYYFSNQIVIVKVKDQNGNELTKKVICN